MVQNTFNRIDVNSLIVLRSDALDKRLALMDSTNPDDRNTAFKITEILVDQFIKPAMKRRPISPSRFGLFDLKALAKTEIQGLVLGLFELKINY